MALTGGLEDGEAVRAEQEESGPALDHALLPDCHELVIDDGMSHAVTNDSVSHGDRVLFIFKFRRVAAQKYNSAFALVLLLHFAQLRKRVDAVNAAVCPEINENELASQIRVQAQRRLHIQPILLCENIPRSQLSGQADLPGHSRDATSSRHAPGRSRLEIAPWLSNPSNALPCEAR